MNFNETDFEEMLYTATKKAFEKVCSDVGHENLYCFSIYTEGGFGYFSPTAMTEEGLEKVFQEYRENGACSSQSDDDLKLTLKWSPCDSPHHLLGDEFFADVNEISSQISYELYELGDDDFTEFETKIYSIVINVLKRLSEDNVFGSVDRDKLFVSMMMGDQDDSVLTIGKQVNLDNSFKLFESDWIKLSEVYSSKGVKEQKKPWWKFW